MRKFLVFLVFACFSISLQAQKNYTEGYIITLNNDTIRGKVKDRFPFRFKLAAKKISFIDSTGIEKDYLPKDIAGYSKADIANYLSIDMTFSKEFARIIVDGYITLVSFKSEGATSTMNANGGMTFGSYSNETFYLYDRITKITTEVSSIGFKDAMADYFSDFPKLKEMIINKELRYADLEIIVEKYNRWKKTIKTGI